MSQPTHSDIANRLDHIIDLLGEVNDAGNGGKGILGSIARLEHRLAAYDRLKNKAIGAFMALGIAVTGMWWLIKGKVAAALGVSP